MNPWLEMEADVHKVRTLCSEWQLERPKYEPFAQNDSWIYGLLAFGASWSTLKHVNLRCFGFFGQLEHRKHVNLWCFYFLGQQSM